MKNLIANFKSAPQGIKLIVAYFILSPLVFLIPGKTIPEGVPSDVLFSLKAFVVIFGFVSCWLAAYFILKKRDWVRKLVIVFAVLSLISNAMTGISFLAGRVLTGMTLFLFIFSSVVNGLFIWYLTRPEAKNFFKNKV